MLAIFHDDCPSINFTIMASFVGDAVVKVESVIRRDMDTWFFDGRLINVMAGVWATGAFSTKTRKGWIEYHSENVSRGWADFAEDIE